jgi:hypothetical protein
MEITPQLLEEMQRRTHRLEQKLRLFQSLFALGFVALLVYACAAMPRAEAAQPGRTLASEVLRVRGLIIVDGEGRERIAIGAPWPSLEGRRSEAQGVGMLIVDQHGVDRINVASPAPDPPGGGQRIAPANGLTFYDQRGNERGGVGYLDNGRSVLVLDNDDGEGAGIFSFTNGYVGVGIMKEGQFRAVMDFDPETQGTRFVMNDSVGRARARLSVPASGVPAWELLDEDGNPLQNR